jgi:phage shock protein A
MPRTADDVESYLHELGRHFDNDGGTYILRTGVAETPVAIRVEPPIVELTVTIGKVPAEDAARLELFRKLLEFNAMDLMLASYGVTDGVVNDLISKSEDPEKMLNQVIVDMNTQLVEAKKQVAVAIADEKRLQKQLQGETTVAEEWQRKAMLAIRAGDDELAKEALLRKKEHDQLAATFQDQWQKQKNATDQLKLALRALNNKIEEAKRKKNVLIAQKRRAEAMKSIQDTMSGLSQTSAFDTFDRMAEKINQMEAEAEAGQS